MKKLLNKINDPKSIKKLKKTMGKIFRTKIKSMKKKKVRH